MTEENTALVLSVASLVDVQSIDGGDTLAMRFLNSTDQEMVMLVPRQVALALKLNVSNVLARPHDPRRFEI